MGVRENTHFEYLRVQTHTVTEVMEDSWKIYYKWELFHRHMVFGEKLKYFPLRTMRNVLKKLKEVLLDTGKEKISLEIESVKFFKQFVILKFKDLDSINDIERYKGKSLYVTRENAVKLGRDEYFIADLIDMNVYDENDAYLGVLINVIETGANDVYEVKFEDGRQVLFPAIKQCILDVDMEKQKK